MQNVPIKSPEAKRLNLVNLLLRCQYKLVTAESCTGGLIAAKLTDLAGSSQWFECGLVTYSNAAKITLLGVPATTLERFGAVSSEVAAEMAIGALSHSQAHIALAVTGIAGPGGGSALKPIGTIFLAIATHTQHQVIALKLDPNASRQTIRTQVYHHALDALILFITQNDKI
ncbi:MAG TPA: damage-inducible protein CinA [Legionellales bacterium]|nr:damage-inducible protein CinA [Legionellales bacterium]HCA90084.1 damage-inducible protein CinA [Legionellales bacterium]|tara:strand:+ start:1246 stop:1761 length:516 start_codon:yes stop_codon:yes gene_type:complete